MRQKIIRVGNSAAITIPKKILGEKGLAIGQEAEIDIFAIDKEPKLFKEFGAWVEKHLS